MGELLQNMFNEVVGEDQQNQRIARLPFNMASANITLQGWTAVLGTTGASLDLL